MTEQQEAALRQALEACQLIVNAFDALKPGNAARTEPLQINTAREAITALRRALEQRPAEEPVAVDVRCPDCGGNGVDAKDNNYGCVKCDGSGFVERIFHTRPQPAAWVGLNWFEVPEKDRNNADFHAGAAWADHQLREKNGGKA